MDLSQSRFLCKVVIFHLHACGREHMLPPDAFHFPGVDQDAVEVWSITTPDGGAGAAAWMDQVGQPWGRNGDMVVAKYEWRLGLGVISKMKRLELLIGDNSFDVCLSFGSWPFYSDEDSRWGQQYGVAAWQWSSDWMRLMHAQCTSNAPPSHSHDTMHEQTIPTTCTHNHRHHAIHSTHLRNSTPFGKHIHPLNSECCLPCLKAQNTGSRGFSHWFTGWGFTSQVQLHKVQEVVQIYQAFLRNIRVSRESWFGPGVDLRFLEKFSKRFLETTNNFETKEMWRGASICQSSNTTSTQACFSEVPQEELPFTFLAMF